MYCPGVLATVPGCEGVASERERTESNTACDSGGDFGVFLQATQNENLVQFRQEHDTTHTNLSECSLGLLSVVYSATGAAHKLMLLLVTLRSPERNDRVE